MSTCELPLILEGTSPTDEPVTIRPKARFVVANVRGLIFSVGKLNRSGYAVNMVPGKGYIERDGFRVPMIMRRNSWYVKVAFVVKQVAPVMDQGMLDEDTQDTVGAAGGGEALVEEPVVLDAPPAVEQPQLPDLGTISDEVETPIMFQGSRLSVASSTEVLRKKLKALSAPVWGTKAQLWGRIVQYEKLADEHRRVQIFIEQREEAINRDPSTQRLPAQVPDVHTASAAERTEHELTHIPYAAWCEICVRSKGRSAPHARTDLSAVAWSKETPLISMDFCKMDTDGETTTEPARAFATTLVLVEDKSGYPLAISLETKGGPSHAYVCAVVDRWLDTLGIKKCRAWGSGPTTGGSTSVDAIVPSCVYFFV